MAENGKQILLNTLNNTSKDIILAGDRGTGKTTIINYALDNSRNIINCTVEDIEYIFLREKNIYNLYYVCLICKKILINIKNNYCNRYMMEFILFEQYIDNIIKQICVMNISGNIIQTDLITNNILNRSELLMIKLINLMNKKLGIKDFTLAIDNFDKMGGGSQMYQEFIYNILKQYFRLILTISDKNVVCNNEKLQLFNNDNEIIKMDYSKDIKIVREILLEEIRNYFTKVKKTIVKKYIHFSLNDETIELMIKKTNGNLFDMISAVKHLCNNVEILNIDEYSSFMLNYIDNEINKDPLLTGMIIPERKLYISPKH